MAKHSILIVTLVFTLVTVANTLHQLNSKTIVNKKNNSNTIDNKNSHILRNLNSQSNLTKIIMEDSAYLNELYRLQIKNLKKDIKRLQNTTQKQVQRLRNCELYVKQNKWESENNLQLQTIIDQKDLEISKLKAENIRLQNSLEAQKESCAIQSKVNNYVADELQNRVKDKDIEIENLNSELITLRNQLQSQANVTAYLNNNIGIFKIDYSNLQDKYTELQKEVQLNYTIVNTVSTQLKKCNDEILQLKSSSTECSVNRTVSTVNSTVIPDYRPPSKAIEGYCPPFGNLTGQHSVRLASIQKSIQIPCNSEVWTVIQRRLEQKLNFKRDWSEYRQGFGDFKSEFFVGLQVIHIMTSSQPHELLIRLGIGRQVKIARYSHFEVAGEDKDFAIKSLGTYSGNAGDGMRINEGQKFTTFDRDNDLLDDGNCAEDLEGAWWFSDCGNTNLNYKHYSQYDTLMLWNNTMELVKSIEMMIRPT